MKSCDDETETRDGSSTRRTFFVMMKDVPIATEDAMANASPIYRVSAGEFSSAAKAAPASRAASISPLCCPELYAATWQYTNSAGTVRARVQRCRAESCLHEITAGRLKRVGRQCLPAHQVRGGLYLAARERYR